MPADAQLGTETMTSMAAADVERYVKMRARLVAASEALARATSAESAAAAAGSALVSLTGAQHAAVFFRSTNGVVTCPWYYRLSEGYVRQLITPEGENPWIHLVRHPELACMDLPRGGRKRPPAPWLLPDVCELPIRYAVRQRVQREGMRSICSWPLTRAGRTIGALAYYYDTPHISSVTEQEILRVFASQAAMAVEHGITARAPEWAEASAEVPVHSPVRVRTGLKVEAIRLAETLRGQDLATERSPLPEGAASLQAEHQRLADAQAALAAENERLANAQRALRSEAEQLTQARQTLNADATRVAAFQTELTAEGARLAEAREHLNAERTQLANLQAQLDAAETVLGHDRQSLETEEARISAARQELEIPQLPALDAGIEREQQWRSSRPAVPAPKAAEATYRALVQRIGAPEVEDDDRQIAMVADLLDARNGYAEGYSKCLVGWVETLARELSCSEPDVQAVRRAALLHGIGTIDVPESTLSKSSDLTADEQAMLREQPVVAFRVLNSVEWLRPAAAILRRRFERWDGTGHPDRIKENAIPLGARMLAVVEAYGAMVMGRPEAPTLSSRDAIAGLKQGAGTQFDPAIVGTFCQIVTRARVGRVAAHDGVVALLKDMAMNTRRFAPMNREDDRLQNAL